ncbi:MAG: hypothetical protein IH588_18510, partial [Anaerolineales bacterium]|nr:hypothetical protein [Anaerolineales bacterium]
MNTGNILSPRWARAAQIAWIATALLCLAFFLVEIQLSRQNLFTSATYANYLTALRTFYMLVHLFMAGFI